MKKWILMILAALFLIGCGGVAEDAPTYRQIPMSEAVEMLAEESGYILLDVRTVEEFRDKHIPGAINIPNESIGTAEISQLPDKTQRIFVYCRSGNRSKTASGALAEMGYTNVKEFGGINDWPYMQTR